MSDLFYQLNQWHWFGIAIVLVIVELLLGASFFLLWVGLGAALVACCLILFPELSWQYQLLIFSCVAIASIVFWKLHLQKNPTKTDKPRLNRRSEQYIGRVFTLEEPIINGRGKIQVDDSFWRIEGDDLPAGIKVEVVGVDGVVLKVVQHDRQ